MGGGPGGGPLRPAAPDGSPVMGEGLVLWSWTQGCPQHQHEGSFGHCRGRRSQGRLFTAANVAKGTSPSRSSGWPACLFLVIADAGSFQRRGLCAGVTKLPECMCVPGQACPCPCPSLAICLPAHQACRVASWDCVNFFVLTSDFMGTCVRQLRIWNKVSAEMEKSRRNPQASAAAMQRERPCEPFL